MITARKYLGAAAYREFIFATGGEDVKGSELATVEKYNTLTNQWSAISSMTTKRYGHASVTCGDSIYSIGGYDGSKLLNSVERYDIQTNQWISIAPIKQARSVHAATSIGESIFVIGGWGSGSYLKSVEMYDTRSNKWMEIAPMNTARYYLAAAICGNSIFAIGGWVCYSSSSRLKTVEKLRLF
jgi:N-acetylneuraminic acid mutarotase